MNLKEQLLDVTEKLAAALEENDALHAEIRKLKAEPKHCGVNSERIVYRLTCIESERGWGQKYEYEYFWLKEDAQKRMDEINARNTETYAPDWYYLAQGIDEVARFRVPQSETIL